MLEQSERTSSALDVVTAHLDAQRRHDVAVTRATLSDTFVERSEHAPALDADAFIGSLEGAWRATAMQTLLVDEISLVDDQIVTVRYRAIPVADAARRVRRDTPSVLGYAVYEVRDGRIATTWRYEVPLPFHTAARDTSATAAPDIASTAVPLAAPAPERHADGPSDDARQTDEQRDEPPKRGPSAARIALRVGAMLAFIAALVVNEIVLSAPVVAATAWVGGALAFAVLVPIYTVIGFTLAAVVLSRCRRSVTPGRLERFVTADVDRPQLRKVRRLAQAGTGIGFVVSSVIFASPATMWLLWQVGARKRADLLALVSSAIFAIVFVASYAGLASLVI